MTLAKQVQATCITGIARASSEKSGEQVEQLAEQAERNARKDATDDPILGRSLGMGR